jgi:hypothetical protein
MAAESAAVWPNSAVRVWSARSPRMNRYAKARESRQAAELL